MSTADPRAVRRVGSRRPRGFTVIEMIITVVILGMTTLVIERTVTGVTETERLMRSIRATTAKGQEGAYRLRDLVATSRKLYGNDTIGKAYLAKLASSGRPDPGGLAPPHLRRGQRSSAPTPSATRTPATSSSSSGRPTPPRAW